MGLLQFFSMLIMVRYSAWGPPGCRWTGAWSWGISWCHGWGFPCCGWCTQNWVMLIRTVSQYARWLKPLDAQRRVWLNIFSHNHNRFFTWTQIWWEVHGYQSAAQYSMTRAVMWSVLKLNPFFMQRPLSIGTMNGTNKNENTDRWEECLRRIFFHKRLKLIHT